MKNAKNIKIYEIWNFKKFLDILIVEHNIYNIDKALYVSY